MPTGLELRRWTTGNLIRELVRLAVEDTRADLRAEPTHGGRRRRRAQVIDELRRRKVLDP